MTHTFGVVYEMDREPTREELLEIYSRKPTSARGVYFNSIGGGFKDAEFAVDFGVHMHIAFRNGQ